jgi:hypothetical protein
MASKVNRQSLFRAKKISFYLMGFDTFQWLVLQAFFNDGWQLIWLHQTYIEARRLTSPGKTGCVSRSRRLRDGHRKASVSRPLASGFDLYNFRSTFLKIISTLACTPLMRKAVLYTEEAEIP